MSALCRTCLRPIAHETRTAPGYLPRTGWYDDARVDALVCFKANDYRHVPLTDRERAYYDAGVAAAERERDMEPPHRAWKENQRLREGIEALIPDYDDIPLLQARLRDLLGGAR